MEPQPRVNSRVLLPSTLRFLPHESPVVLSVHYSSCSKLPAPELSVDLWVLLRWNVLGEAECLMSHIQVTLEDEALECPLLH